VSGWVEHTKWDVVGMLKLLGRKGSEVEKEEIFASQILSSRRDSFMDIW
jgi:hypothetical protein